MADKKLVVPGPGQFPTETGDDRVPSEVTLTEHEEHEAPEPNTEAGKKAAKAQEKRDKAEHVEADSK